MNKHIVQKTQPSGQILETARKLFRSREATSIIFIILLFLGVGMINPNFLSVDSIMLCFNGSVVYTVIAVGIAFVIITGEIDVSVGATLGISAAVSASMIRDGQPWALAFMTAVCIGLCVGLINGMGVTMLKIPSIIMTLGINGIVRGAIYIYTDGKWVENLPFAYKALSQGRIFDTVTWFYLSALILTAAIHILLAHTKKGKYFAATGDNVNGATLLGIPVKLTKLLSFVICSVLAAVGGLLYVSRVGFVTPIAGSGYEMKVIAACVLGGISLSGGVGSVLGAAVGAVIMASISRVLVFMGFSSDYDNTITGILLIFIVVTDALLQHRSVEMARRQRLSAKTDNHSAKVQEVSDIG
jgi:AI-2 transport system permease protein